MLRKMLNVFFSLAIIQTSLLSELQCARILCYFNIGLYSRHVMYQALTKELANRGHELVVITSRPRPLSDVVQNLTEIDVSVTANDSCPSIYSGLQSAETNDPVVRLRIAMQSTTMELEQQLQTKAFQKLIKEKKKYNLLLVEPMSGAGGLALSHIFQVPVILVRTTAPSLREFEMAGFEMHSQFMYSTRTKATNLALCDAAVLAFNEYQLRQDSLDIEVTVNEILKRNIGPDVPPLEELWKNVQAVMTNVHWLWDNNIPVPPNMVYMGNIVPQTEKKLPKDIQNFLDASKRGVIYLSFGSIFDFSLLPEAKMNIFLDVFSALPYEVLMKCKKQLHGLPSNVRAYKWLPQTDVLRHPKIKLFITQGGLHSTDEAISAGVPILGVPMFSDQWDNVAQYVKFKIGTKVDLNLLTEETLMNAINMVVTNPSYAAATRRLSSQFERRFAPMERAVLTVERVLRTAAIAHPRSARERCPELSLLAAAALVLLMLIAIWMVKLMVTMSKNMFLRFHRMISVGAMPKKLK